MSRYRSINSVDSSCAVAMSTAAVIIILATCCRPLPGMAADDATPDRLHTLFIIGDSTVNNDGRGLQGWGTPIAKFFDPAKLKVVNRARGGRSSRTYFAEALWDQVAAQLQPGDFVMMQFGHNDGGAVTGPRQNTRASIKGAGDETEETTDAVTGKKEVVHSYGWYLRRYVEDTKAKGATPIMLSPIPRNDWQGDKVVRASANYGKWAMEVAKSQNVPFVDLNEIIARQYDKLGPAKVKEFFPYEHTHTNPAGALLNATSVVAGLKALQPCPVGAYLSAQGRDVAAADLTAK